MEIIMRISDRVVVIGAGANVCEGSPEKVAHDPRVIEIYLGGEIPHA
jgi:branched-chain amino acid transport system ATP-binding protein